MEERLQVYMSGPLTGLPPDEKGRLEGRYDLVQKMCAIVGYDCYCPHQHSDPQRNAAMTKQEVRELDRRHVVEADLLIVDCSLPSHGAGVECGWAEDLQIPVLLIAEQQRQGISRLIQGLLNVVTVAGEPDILRFSTPEQLAARLREQLQQLRPTLLTAKRRRTQQTRSRAALVDYARSQNLSYRRYEQLQEAVAAVGGALPLTMEEWEKLDGALG